MTIGVINLENIRKQYIITGGISENVLFEKTIVLENNEKWEEQITLSDYIDNFSEEQLIKFDLYQENACEEPYRSLHLWIT